MRDRKRGTVRDLRRQNRAAVLWSLYLSQPRSRQELGAATGLSAASVTNVVRELIDEGIVIETGLAESDGGRPRTMLGMNPGYGYVIGVDIGETRTRVELFDLTMTERARAEYPLDQAAEHDVAVVVGQIASGLDTVLAGSGIDRSAILGVGIGVPLHPGSRSAVAAEVGALGKISPLAPQHALDLRFDQAERLLITLGEIGTRLAQEGRQGLEPYAVPNAEIVSQQLVRETLTRIHDGVNLGDSTTQIHRVVGREKPPNNDGAVRR